MNKLLRKIGVLLRGELRIVLKRWRLLRRDRDRFTEEALRHEGFCSQHGQDKWLVEYVLSHQRAGFFVDVGAYDGIEISNTWLLESKYGWSGICVEPIPSVFAKLRQNRRCECVQGCVASYDGETTFLEVEGNETLSGMAATVSGPHQARIEGSKIRKLRVPCFRLDTLLKERGVSKIDFLSIDTEGSELAILRSIDWRTVKIGAICVENTYHGDLIAELLCRQGYRLDAILAGDEIYVQTKY